VFRGKLEKLSFPLTVPRNPRDRRLVVSLHGPSQGGAGGLDALLSALTGGLGGPTGPPLPGPGPSSIAQLRHKFAAIGSYDGIDAKFSGGRFKGVYRNRSLLITGKTALSILVK
jgi:hypothetical protein